MSTRPTFPDTPYAAARSRDSFTTLLQRLVALALLGMAAFMSPGTAMAVDNTECQSRGGKELCTPPTISPWKYDLCEETVGITGRYPTQCAVWEEGTWTAAPYGGICANPNPNALNDGNLKAKVIEYERRIQDSCQTDSTDSGWFPDGQSVQSNYCYNGGPTYIGKTQISNLRRFNASGKRCSNNSNWSQTVTGHRGRTVTCPADIPYSRVGSDGEAECHRPSRGCFEDPIKYLSEQIGPYKWKWSDRGTLTDPDTRCNKVVTCACGQTLDNTTGTCKDLPANNVSRKQPGARLWRWSTKGDLDTENPLCFNTVTCGCNETFSFVGNEGKCVSRPASPAAQLKEPKYLWKWSRWADFEEQTPKCYDNVPCTCGQTIDVATGTCKPDPAAVPGKQDTKPPRGYRWSKWSDFTTQICFKDIDCPCGERLDVQTGSCKPMTGLTKPLIVKLEELVTLTKKKTKYKVSVTGDPDEACFVLKEDITNCCSSSGSNQSAAGQTPCSGNPVNCAMGTKEQTDRLFAGIGPDRLGMSLRYRSVGLDQKPLTASGLGSLGGWQLSTDVSLESMADGAVAVIHFPGGQQHLHLYGNGSYEATQQGHGRLLRLPGGWQLTGDDGRVFLFDTGGRLFQQNEVGGRQLNFSYAVGLDGVYRLSLIEDRFGRRISLTYDGSNRLWMLKAPDNGTYSLGYNPLGALGSVQFPDGGLRSYLYDDVRFPYALTGIVDGSGASYAHFGYDATGRAVLTEHAGGAERLTVDYIDAEHARLTTQTTPFTSTSKLYTYDYIGGEPRISRIEWKPCASCATVAENFEFDANGFLTRKIAADGTATTFQRDERGNELFRTEAVGTALARSTSTQWDSVFRLPLEVVEGNLRTRYIYDAAGRMVNEQRTDLDTGEIRVRQTEYDLRGLPVQKDGPREDVADLEQLAYDAQGNLVSVTNALGQLTELLAHDGAGRPRQTRQAGAVTNLGYDAAGRLVSRERDGATWRYEYDGAGHLKRVVSPTGGALRYQYDDAGRRIGETDETTGGSIAYSLDARGNPLRTEARDASGALLRLSGQVRDDLGRLVQILDADNRGDVVGYDLLDRPVSLTDVLGNSSATRYDRLGRVDLVTDALQAGTAFTHDRADRVTSVTDARGLVTQYLYNAFGELKQQTSPDSGLTRFDYDKAGNQLRRQDARGVVTDNRYDALNRLTETRYQDGTTADALRDLGIGGPTQYQYDGSNDPGTPNAIGRLTGVSTALEQTRYRYDARGNRVQERRVSGTVVQETGYTYDAADRLIAITYPGGRTVRYPRDAAGRVQAVRTQVPGGAETLLASQIEYEGIPGGRWTLMQLGDPSVLSSNYQLNTNLQLSLEAPQRRYDLNGRLIGQDVTAPGLNSGLIRDYEYGPRGELLRILDYSLTVWLAPTVTASGATFGASAKAQRPTQETRYRYDAVSRLIEASGPFGAVDYQYDALGNRLHQRWLPPQSDLSASNLNGPAAAPIPVLTDHRYAADSQRLVGRTVTGNTAINPLDEGNHDYAYGSSGQASQAGSLRLLYDARDRSTVIADLDPKHLSTVIQDYDGSGLRTKKLGNGQLTRYAYDAQGHLLEESSQSANLALQQADPFATQALNVFNQAVRNVPDAVSPFINGLPASGLDEIKPVLDEQLHTYGNITSTLSETLQADLRYRAYPDRREIVWLDDQPLAVIQPRKQGAPQELFFVHADHLNTPQRIIDAAGLLVWQNTTKPFGEPYQAPQPPIAITQTQAALPQTGINSGLSQGSYVANTAIATVPGIAFNLRFPGQYADTETGLHQNWHRDYDPSTGRYIESDPVGLTAGVNTYLYANANPVSFTDPMGLAPKDKLFGLPKQFWNWYHRQVKKPGDPDLNKDEAKAMCDDWESQGKPGPDNKGNRGQGGSADMGLLEWLIPWQIMPMDAGCPNEDCNQNGLPDYDEPGP